MPEVAVRRYKVTIDIEMDSAYMQHQIDKNRDTPMFVGVTLDEMERLNENGMLSSMFRKLGDIGGAQGTELMCDGTTTEYESEEEDREGRVYFSNLTVTVARQLDTTRDFADDLRKNGVALHAQRGHDDASDPR